MRDKGDWKEPEKPMKRFYICFNMPAGGSISVEAQTEEEAIEIAEEEIRQGVPEIDWDYSQFTDLVVEDEEEI